jgi:hypothetical protein
MKSKRPVAAKQTGQKAKPTMSIRLPSTNGQAHPADGLDVDPEALVLGSVLRDERILEEVLPILPGPEFFSSIPHQMIYSAILFSREEDLPIDRASVCIELKERKQIGQYLDQSYLEELYEGADYRACGKRTAAFARRVKEQALRRMAVEHYRSALHQAEHPNGSIEEFFADQEAEFSRLILKARSTSPRSKFAQPVPCSQLRAPADGRTWVWDGYFTLGAVTLFSGLWKAGKTTLLAQLLKAMRTGGKCCGLDVRQGNVLYVSEESEDRWAERRDELGLGDNCCFQIRPFLMKSNFGEWYEFLSHIEDVLKGWPCQLLIFDTLSNLWPVSEENDAPQVQRALQPLHRITTNANCAIGLGHHLSKADGKEGKGSRGSGALPAFVNIVLEFRRYAENERTDRRRVLSAWSHWEVTPELVVELRADGSEYIACGDKGDVKEQDIQKAILEILPNELPGKNYEEIVKDWPSDSVPTKKTLLAALKDGLDGEAGPLWQRQGKGVSGSPWTYWVRAPG